MQTNDYCGSTRGIKDRKSSIIKMGDFFERKERNRFFKYNL